MKLKIIFIVTMILASFWVPVMAYPSGNDILSTTRSILDTQGNTELQQASSSTMITLIGRTAMRTNTLGSDSECDVTIGGTTYHLVAQTENINGDQISSLPAVVIRVYDKATMKKLAEASAKMASGYEDVRKVSNIVATLADGSKSVYISYVERGYFFDRDLADEAYEPDADGCWAYAVHIHMSPSDVVLMKNTGSLALDIAVSAIVTYCTGGWGVAASFAVSSMVTALYEHGIDDSLNSDGSSDTYMYLKIYRSYSDPDVYPVRKIHRYPSFSTTDIYGELMRNIQAGKLYQNVYHVGDVSQCRDGTWSVRGGSKWYNVPIDTTHL